MDDEENWASDSNDSDNSDSDMEDSSDEEKNKKKKKKNKQLNPKNATLAASKKNIEDQQKKDFFDDL